MVLNDFGIYKRNDTMKKITITIEDDDYSSENTNRSPYPWETTSNNGWVNGVDLCAKCPNNPANGGTGICFCTIPNMYGPNRITCCVATNSIT